MTREPVCECETDPSREMGAAADKGDGRRKWWRWRAARASGQLGLLFLLQHVGDYSRKHSHQHSHPPLTICLPSTGFPLPTVLVPS